MHAVLTGLPAAEVNKESVMRPVYNFSLLASS